MPEDTNSYDVAIVGAGLMGAATALFLARGGMRCLLVDRKGVCAEASGVNAGTLTLQMTRAALIPYGLKGWEMWTRPGEWLGMDPGVTATHGLSLAFTAEEAEILSQRAELRRAQGAEIDIVSPAKAREIEPGLSDRVLLASHCAIDGHVTANRTGLALRKALVEAGVALQEGAPVSAVHPEEGVFAVVSTAATWRAQRLVLAGGVWLEEMLGWLGIRIAIKTLFNQLIVTERLQPVMRSVVGIASGLLSLKQFANGTVLIGGGWQGKGDRDSHVTEILPENMIGNVRLARHAIPALAGTRLVRAWLGFEAETDDAMPIVGALPGIPGAFAIGSVHSGYTSGPYMARLLAERMLGREPALPLFDPARLIATAPSPVAC